MTSSLPPAPPPPSPGSGLPAAAEAPRELRPVVLLLMINLALSLAVTIATVLARHSIVDYQFDHRHITDPAVRDTLSHSYVYSIISRVVGNIIVSVVYVFLVRALLRGRRWAYRRVIWLGIACIIALLALQATPYPAWMRVEQLVQALVLAALVYFILRPPVRTHFAKGTPRPRRPTLPAMR